MICEAEGTNAPVIAMEEGTKRVDEGVQLAGQAQAVIERTGSRPDQNRGAVSTLFLD